MSNKFDTYRSIRFKRTYRTLGKMSWWRIVLGLALMCYVLLLSGLVSQLFASREKFVVAEKLMISPEWMDEYKPETKAFIEAGVLYENGNFNEALEKFNEIKDFEAAEIMISRVNTKLVSEKINNSEYVEAYDVLKNINFDFLNKDDAELYLSSCGILYDYFLIQADDEYKFYTESLMEMISMYSEIFVFSCLSPPIQSISGYPFPRYR